MEPVFKIHEIFESIQGEGIRSGTWSTFVRFAGCNLSCVYCDTPEPKEKDIVKMNEQELLTTVAKHDPRYVVLTGGEPCLQITANLVFQIRKFARVAIETNGTVDNPALEFASHVAVSPKNAQLAASYYDKQIIIHELRIPVTKFRVEMPNLRRLNIHHLVFSPIFEKDGTLDPAVLTKALNLVSKFRFRGGRLSVQLHKLLGIK